MPINDKLPQDPIAEVSVPESSPSTTTQIAGQIALIVDSGPELNALLKNLFLQEKWGVQVAAGNDEAFELSRQHSYDLIVTGVATSGIEDLEFLRRLRRILPHVRLIILTHKFAPGDVLAAIREQVFSYFSQPIATERLAEMVRIAMSEPPAVDGLEVLSFVPNWIRIRVRCDLATANRLLQFYREASGLPGAQTEELASAFREVLINAMEHGANFDPAQSVEVGYARTDQMVLFRVKDPGPGFSMSELAHSAVGNPEDDPFRHMDTRESLGKRPGGFGILIARQLVDELIYNEKGNDVLVVKYLDHRAKATNP